MDQNTSTLSRRDRKRNATRQAIVEAALDLFEQQGFATTTIDQITERADVAQRTFFRHFATKEAVLFPDTEDGASRFGAALEAQPTSRPLLSRVLDAFAVTMAESGADDHDLSARRQAILQAEGTAGHAITWDSMVAGHRIIEEAVASQAGLSTDNEQVQLVAATALLLLSQAMPEFYAAGTTADLSAILDRKYSQLRDLLAS